MFKFAFEQSDMLARAGILRTSELEEEILTPIITPTSTNLRDIRALAESDIGFPHEYAHFPHPIVELNRMFTKKGSLEALNDTEVSNTFQKNIKRSSKSIGLGKLSIFRPIIKREAKITPEINRILVRSQLMSDIDIIAVMDPSFDSSMEEYGNAVKKAIEEKDEYGTTPAELMPVIRMDISKESFKAKINLAIDCGLKGVVLIYSSPAYSHQNFPYLLELRQDQNFFIHMTGVGQKWQSNKKTSVPHVLQLLADSISIRPPRVPPYGLVKFKPKIPELFDYRTWGLEPYTDLDRSGMRFSSCPIHFGRKRIGDAIKLYDAAGLLSKCIRLHNVWEGYAEMENCRQPMLERSFRSYVRSKKYGAEAVSKIFKIDLRQNTLLS